MMEAIVLAGGFGTRLKSVVSDVPKPMAPVAGRPFLEILFRMLARKGFTHLILSVGHMSDKIIAYFGDEFLGMRIEYAAEDTPLGTGGAIRTSLTRCDSDHAFVFNGDTYLDLDVFAVEEQWRKHCRPIIVLRHVDNAARFGRVEIASGRIAGFFEKGEGGPGLINAGCYVLPVDLLSKFPVGQPFSFEKDFLAKQAPSGNFDAYVCENYFLDIGIPEDYARANTELASNTLSR